MNYDNKATFFSPVFLKIEKILKKISFFILVPSEEPVLTGVIETGDDHQENKVNELISFDSGHHTSSGSMLTNSLQDQKMNVCNKTE